MTVEQTGSLCLERSVCWVGSTDHTKRADAITQGKGLGSVLSARRSLAGFRHGNATLLIPSPPSALLLSPLSFNLLYFS